MTNIFDLLYHRYDAWYDRYRCAYLSELRAVGKVLPVKGRGLEIGVGTGRFAAPLGISIGIDPSAKMLAIAKRRGVDARLGYGEELPFKPESFDYAVLIVTLCFAKRPQKVLDDAKRVLKKNGKLIIGIIDQDSFLGKAYQKKGSIFYKRARFFSVPELTHMLAVKGFDRFIYYQTLSQLPENMRRVESPKKGFGRCGFVVILSQKK